MIDRAKASRLGRLRTLLDQNRPSRKPQLWEDFPLSFRRRLAFETRTRLDPGWLERPVTVTLSRVGLDGGDHRPLRVQIQPREMVSQAMFLYGVFEISETRLVQAFLRPGMTFVDVGANLGYYTLIAARLVGPSGRVHAFEPNARMRAALEHNIALNSLPNVEVHDQAVSDVVGEISFYESSWEANQGISSIYPGSARSTEVRVSSTTLDRLVSEGDGRRIDLVKMDIEGAEHLAIAGGRALFSASDAPGLIFEAADVTQMEPLVQSLGYHVRRIQYTLDQGLQLVETAEPDQGLFSAYEAPNYFASKDPGVFGQLLERANANRSPLLRLLGRV